MGQLKSYLVKLSWVHVIVIVALTLGYSYYMLDPNEIEAATFAITEANKSIESMKAKILEAEEFQRQFEDRKRKFSEMVGKLQQMKGALPKEFLLPELSSELLKEAKRLGIQINQIVPDNSETVNQNYNSIGFQIDATGTFVQLFIFMDRLSSATRLMNVQNFTFVKDSNKTVTLGGELGSFAGSNLTGGRTEYPALVAQFRIVTYRYIGGR